VNNNDAQQSSMYHVPLLQLNNMIMQYKLFGNSGCRVSELCLGTMTMGEEWGYGANKEESRKIFETFLDAGGNFIDTANRYTEGTSELFLGEFIKDSGRRDELVLATKYSLFTKPGRLNDGGNHRKNMIQSVEGSLQRLQTDCIDILYLHAWDFTTSEYEVMRGLDDLEYSLITRDAERDLIPMANHSDIAVTAWAPLAGGALTGKYLNRDGSPKRLKEGSKRLNDKSVAIAQEVVKIAEENNCAPAQVALQWVMQKHPQIFPVIGARSAEQIAESIACVNTTLTDEQMQRLNQVSAFDIGFPHDFLAGEGVRQVLFGGFQDKTINHRKK